jgi:hypothetical protein
MTDLHLVVEGTEGNLSVAAALDGAGVVCDCAEPEQLVRLEPIGVCALDGWRAQFRNRPARSFTGIVVVGPPPRLPWLDPGLLDWEAGRPRLVAGVLAPGLANLYIVGLGPAGPRPGRLDLVVSMIRSQAGLDQPLVDELVRFVAPSHHVPVGPAVRRLERQIRRRLKAGGGAPWWAAVRELDGPLNTSRGA